MDPGAIEAMIAAIGVQVANATAALVPVGVVITLSFIVLGIVLIGADLMTGSSFMPQLVRFTGVAAGTMWAITEWPNIAKQTLDAARAATALLVPGYAGPTGLFTVATDISGRLIVEGSSWSWSAPLTSMADAVMLGLAPFLIEFGLAITGLLAALAEIELLLGSACAPLILPAIAFGPTAQLGFGAVSFLVSAAVRVIVLGATSHVMAQAVTATIAVGGIDTALTHPQIMVLFLLAILCAVVGVSTNGIARSLVGGGVGSLGLGSVQTTTSVAAGAVNMGSSSVGAAAKGLAGVRGDSAAAVGALGRGVAAVAKSSGVGSAFER